MTRLANDRLSSGSTTVEPSSPAVATTALAAAVILLGLHWPVMRVALDYVPPLWFSVLRQVGGIAVMFAVLAAIGRLRAPTRQDLPIILGVGVLQIAGLTALSMVGLLYVEPGRAAILCYTTPFWVTLISFVFLGTRPARLEKIGLLLGFAGALILVSPWSFDWGDGAQLFGIAMLFAAAIIWSIAILQIRHHKWHLGPLQLMPYMMIAGTVVLAPVALVVEGWPPTIEWNVISFATLVFTTLSTCFAVWATSAAGRVMSPVSVALLLLAVPFIGLGSSALWLHETVTAIKLASLALIFAGSVMGILHSTRRSGAPGRTTSAG